MFCQLVFTNLIKNLDYCTSVANTTKSAYADILFAIATEYQNDTYHYYLELCANAIQTIKEQVRPDIHK